MGMQNYVLKNPNASEIKFSEAVGESSCVCSRIGTYVTAYISGSDMQSKHLAKISSTK